MTDLLVGHEVESQPKRYRKVATVLAAVAVSPGLVGTPEGAMMYEAGDYLVTDDPPTHVWPVKRTVFESTHERIDE